MFRVRLINKIIGPANGIFPVCGKSTKLYGHASYMPEHGGPVLDMSLEDYDRDKFDIIGNKVSGQQWVPQFYEQVVVSDEILTATDWRQYKRKGLSEMRPYVIGEDVAHVSISEPDKQNGSPREGDMIARNPENHGDQWLVSKKYFEDNLEPTGIATAGPFTFDANGNIVEPSDEGIIIESAVVTDHGNGNTVVIHSGRAKLLQFNELRKRAKAADVWKPGMKLADIEKALSAVGN